MNSTYPSSLFFLQHAERSIGTVNDRHQMALLKRAQLTDAETAGGDKQEYSIWTRWEVALLQKIINPIFLLL